MPATCELFHISLFLPPRAAAGALAITLGKSGIKEDILYPLKHRSPRCSSSAYAEGMHRQHCTASVGDTWQPRQAPHGARV